jgi:hypothetical protein
VPEREKKNSELRKNTRTLEKYIGTLDITPEWRRKMDTLERIKLHHLEKGPAA